MERFKEIRAFEAQDFWFVEMVAEKKGVQGQSISCEPKWDRKRLFDKAIVTSIMNRCLAARIAVVTEVKKKPTKKFRPYPLNTIEAQKLISRKLRISPAQSMQVMEKLYNRGFLSYPRTETTKYNKTINLKQIVGSLENSPEFGDFAVKLLSSE